MTCAGKVDVLPVRSGSSGNLTAIRHGMAAILVDAGLPSRRAIDDALAEADLSWDRVDALLVSHLHGDHVNAHTVARCAEHGVPVHIHEKNLRMFESRVFSRLDEKARDRFNGRALLRPFGADAFEAGGVYVRAFQVPHDAVGMTVGFRLRVPCGEGWVRISMATDLGHGGDGLHESFVDSDLILLEANHDERMLAESRRHDRARVGSDSGHLSNRQAATLLLRAIQESDHRPEEVVLCHLSGDHNSGALAASTVHDLLSRHDFREIRVRVAPSRKPVTLSFRGGGGRSPGI